MKRIGALAAALALGACATTTPRTAPVAPPIVIPPAPPKALEQVMGRTATQLVQLFGNPDQDLRERIGRRLQFVGPACVLDTYLYPPARGGEAVVTYIDARRPDGADMDRAQCIGALMRRR